MEEEERLTVLRAYGVLDTARDDELDDITRLASFIAGTPTALISFIDEHRQWFKAAVGFDRPETPREEAFCTHAIQFPDEVLVVRDARHDPRFATNPLVTGEPHIRFYAGAPLVTPEGHALGTLCVIDGVPRELNDSQLDALRALARQVMALLDERRNAGRVGRSDGLAPDDPDAKASLAATEQKLARRAAALAEAEHKLKTPLTIIKGWVHTLQRDWTRLDDEGRNQGLSTIATHTDRLVRQVEALLRDAQAEALADRIHIERIDLRRFLADEVTTFSKISPSHEVVLGPVDDLTVAADREALHQIIGHLIDNSAKYADGGPITVSATAGEGCVEISVADEGPGLPAGIDVFAAYERGAAARATAKGAGLGLHIVRNLATAMAGSARAANRADGRPGAVMTVVVPRADP
ncbi:MAG TPA: GAF domain-containing sensor histidine kinase [Acidimicrobiales bacterium]|jgi:two-component system, sensor histidine kinase|nr:GAF domain-containing sensor histidine kinase [Acidimicrobiales bacterium]